MKRMIWLACLNIVIWTVALFLYLGVPNGYFLGSPSPPHNYTLQPVPPLYVGVQSSTTVYPPNSAVPTYSSNHPHTFYPIDPRSLLNITNFHWIHNPFSVCHDLEKTWLILVHSARSNFNYRQLIRETWGSLKTFNGSSIRTLFLLGMGHPVETTKLDTVTQDKMIANESSFHGDIILGNFIDSYQNLTYKTLMGFKWTLEYCPGAKFVVKTDDDVYLHMRQFISKLEEGGGVGGVPPNLFCDGRKNEIPIRDETIVWFVSKQEYPEEFYPTYCGGAGYGMTVELMHKLYSLQHKVRFFWIEDIFVTGLLTRELAKEYMGFKLVPKYNLDVTYVDGLVETKDFTWSTILLLTRENFEQNLKTLFNFSQI